VDGEGEKCGVGSVIKLIYCIGHANNTKNIGDPIK